MKLFESSSPESNYSTLNDRRAAKNKIKKIQIGHREREKFLIKYLPFDE